MRPEPDPLRWLPLQAGLAAGLLAAAVAAAVVALALRMEAPLERERAAGQQAVLDMLAAELGHALDLGIPLAGLPDLDSHLATTLDQSPALSAVTIAMPDGFQAAAAAPAPADLPLSAPLRDGSITLYRTPDRSLARRLRAVAGGTALAAGLAAALLAHLLVLRPGRRAARSLAQRLVAVAAGDFTAAAEPAGLPPDSLATELEAWRAWVARRRQRLGEQAAGVRAIDFDGSLGPRVDAALARADAGRRFPADAP